MESFRWGPHFFTGVDTVDEQHHMLVTMLNRYGSALAENTLDHDHLQTLFDDLADYAREHFKTEEEIMINTPIDRRHIRRHVSEHEGFVQDVAFMAKDLDSEDGDHYRTMLDFLIHWLAYHILGIDQVMARQVKAVENGLAADEAYKKEEQDRDDSSEPLLAALSGLFALVSKRNKALVELNRTLEQRVSERTRELVEANRELEIISVTDHLTGLPNRRFAMRQMHLFVDEAKQGKNPLSVLMIDADGFKQVNDTYGHDAGDIVLKELALELKHAVRSDDLVCRLGGDEFLVICPNTGLKGALYLGEQIRSIVAKMEIPVGEGCWHGSVSIGAAVTVPEQENVDRLLKSADEAVYHAKRDGRNCVRGMAERVRE